MTCIAPVGLFPGSQQLPCQRAGPPVPGGCKAADLPRKTAAIHVACGAPSRRQDCHGVVRSDGVVHHVRTIQ